MNLSGPSIHADDVEQIGWAGNAVPLITINYHKVAARALRLMRERIAVHKDGLLKTEQHLIHPIAVRDIVADETCQEILKDAAAENFEHDWPWV